MIERIHRTIFTTRRALYSPCDFCRRHTDPPIKHMCHELYRYLLEITWNDSLSPLMIIGLNPSTADHFKNDNTLERCERFAREWGFGSLLMTNIFAARATDPEVMKTWKDPVGPENTLQFLQECSSRAGKTIAAWGTHGAWLNRGEFIKKSIPRLDCLGLSANGAPKHPLYLPKTVRPVPFNYEAA